MASATASHYSQHALASLRRRPYHHHHVAPPSPTPSLSLSPPPLRARPASISSIAGLIPTNTQFSMVDFLRSQAESPRLPKPRPLSVVDALAHRSPTFSYAAVPTSPTPSTFDYAALASPPPSMASSSFPISLSSSHHYTQLPTTPKAPQTPKTPRTPRTPKTPPPARTPASSAKKNRDSAVVSFFRTFSSDPTPDSQLRPLLLTPAARPATPNPNRVPIKDDAAMVVAATQSRTVPIGGRRAARARAQRRQWEESYARGRPALSLDVSEMSFSERIETPVEVFAPVREWEYDAKKASVLF